MLDIISPQEALCNKDHLGLWLWQSMIAFYIPPSSVSHTLKFSVQPAGQQHAQRSSIEEERRPRSSMEEEKGSTSSSGSMQSCRTHASSSTEDITMVQQKPLPGAQTLQALPLQY